MKEGDYMKKFFSLLTLMSIVVSLFCFDVSAMISVMEEPGATTVLVSAGNLAEFKSNASVSYVASTYDGSNKNGIAVTGIGSKDATDESIKVVSRVKTGGTNAANFRIDVNLANLYKAGGVLEDCVYTDDDGYIMFNTDMIHEFKIMPNKHITAIKVADRTNTFAVLEGLSTTGWTDVKVLIDSDKSTAYTFVNGELYATKSNLSKGANASQPAAGYLRIHGNTLVPDEFTEQSEITCDADVYFYIDDYKISSTTVTTPVVYLEETSTFKLNKGSRINSGNGSNTVVNGVLGKASSDKVLKLVTCDTNTSTSSWYGYSASAAAIVTDLTSTTMDTIYETSFAVPEGITKIIIRNDAGIVSFKADDLRINQWNKVKAVYSPSTSKWTIYLNGKTYGESTSKFEGKYRFWIDTPVGQSDTIYLDSIRVYQAPAGVEQFEEATLELPETYEVETAQTVASVKTALGINPEDNAIFYKDDTYTETLSDSDIVADGAIIVAQNQYEIFQYCTISAKVHGSLSYSGTAKYSDTQFTTGTMSVMGYSDIPANIYIAQYNENGNVIDVAVSETKTGTVTLDYEPLDRDGKLKIFFWDEDYKPIAESVSLEYKKSLDVLIVGNSFSRDTLFYLRDIAKEYDIDINMGLAYSGGKNLEWHYDNRENGLLTFYVNNFGGSAAKTNVSLNSILTDTDYNWDVIILQNYINSTPDGVKESIWEKGVDLAEYVYGLTPESVLKLNMIWSTELGYGKMTTEELQDTTDEYLSSKNYKLADDIEERLSLDYQVEVVPVGTSIADARDYVDENGLNVFGATYYAEGYTALADLYVNDRNNKSYVFGYGVMSDEEKNAGMIKLNRDGFHLTPIARYLASAMWFEALTGESIYKSTFMPPADTNLGCSLTASDGTGYYLYGTFVEPDSKYVNIMKQIAHGR